MTMGLQLFYLSFQGGQMAACALCGGALFKWTESDIPFIEHANTSHIAHISDM